MKRPPFEKAFRPNYGVLLVVMLNIACCQVCRGVTTGTPTVPGNTTDSTNNSTSKNYSDVTTTTRIQATTTMYQTTSTTTKCKVTNCDNCTNDPNSCETCEAGYYLDEVDTNTTTVSTGSITTGATTTTTIETAISVAETAATTNITVPVVSITTSTQSAANATTALRGSTHMVTKATTTATETKMVELATAYRCSPCKDPCMECSNKTYCTKCKVGYDVGKHGKCIGSVSSESFWSKYLYFVVGGASGGVLLLVIISMAVCCIRRRRRLISNSQGRMPDLKDLNVIPQDKHRDDEAKRTNTYIPSSSVTAESQNITSGNNEPKINRQPAPPPLEVIDGRENISSGNDEPKSPEGKKPRMPAPPPLEVVDPPALKLDFAVMSVPRPPSMEVSETSHSYGNMENETSHMYGNMENETSHTYGNMENETSRTYGNMENETSHTYGNMENEYVHGNEKKRPDYVNLSEWTGQPQSDEQRTSGSVSASCPQLATTSGVMRHQPNSDQPRSVSNGSEDYYNMRGVSDYYNGVILPPTQN